MGAWGYDIFDNDTAADFSSYVENCSDTEARQDLLMATMGAVLEASVEPEAMAEGYEFDYKVEQALAAAAYVADARNGRHDFTDTAYAMGLREDADFKDDDAWYHLDIGTPSQALVDRAVLTVEKIIEAMLRYSVAAEWREPSEKLYTALLEHKKAA